MLYFVDCLLGDWFLQVGKSVCPSMFVSSLSFEQTDFFAVAILHDQWPLILNPMRPMVMTLGSTTHNDWQWA